jgi:ankyrin repeat protein
MCGHSRTLSYLLRLGASPNVCDSSGNSCLHYACAYGWYYCTRTLLDAGAQVNVLNDWKLTPFGTAFLKGHVGLCDQLIALYPKQIDINFRTEDGETLVMLAVSSAGPFNKASVDQLEYIVTKLGGNCQLTDSKGSNAFHYLASNMVYGQVIKTELYDNTNRDQLVETALQEHLKYRNQIAEILLRSGCNPNAENSEFETPFFTAIANSNVSFARHLLEKMSVGITDRQSPSGKTMLSLMAEKCVDLDICSIITSNKELFSKHLV